MSLTRHAPLWLAATLALTAIANVAAFLFSDKGDSDNLLYASIAAVLGTVSMLTGVCLVSFAASEKRRGPTGFERPGGRVLSRVVGSLVRRSTSAGHHPERRRKC